METGREEGRHLDEKRAVQGRGVDARSVYSSATSRASGALLKPPLCSMVGSLLGRCHGGKLGDVREEQLVYRRKPRN